MGVVVSGVQGNGIVARQEIRTMMQDVDLFTLYLLGCERLQATEETFALSWFQIGGIHGRPYTAYDAPASNPVGTFGGYCTHSSILFPPWHRPYVALFEQALAGHVQQIASEYPEAIRQRYTEAAARFRVPYWDWAYYADPPDVVSKQKQVTLNTPTGVRTLDNPLYQYKFHPSSGQEFTNVGQFSTWPETVRWPTSTRPDAQSQPDRMDSGLDNQKLSLRAATYNLLTSSTDYGWFSNDTYQGPKTDPRNYMNIETLHNGIHGSIGGSGIGGHMGNPDFAAFDPMFMLHHANVDRIFTIWQALNPNSYIDTVSRQANPRGTFTTPARTVETIDSPLTPFKQTRDSYWTAAGARDTRTFNYTYPELERWASLSPSDKPARLYNDINALYGPAAPWSAINPGLFANATASVPLVSRKAASNFAPDVTTDNTLSAVNVPQASVASIPATAPPPVFASAQESQVPMRAPEHKTAVLDAATIRKNMEAGIQSVTDNASGTTGSRGSGTRGSGTASAAHKVAAAITGAGDVAITTVQNLGSSVPATVATALSGQPEHQTPISVPGSTGRKQYNEWVANILVEKYAVKTSFFVHIFLGDFDPDPTKWLTEPNLVGSYYAFANNLDTTGCERCQDNADNHELVTGVVPLTGALGDRLGQDKIASLEPDEIIPYLTRELHWRIQTTEKVIERQDIPSLKVSVAQFPVAIPDNLHQLPVWSEGVTHTAVTAGRPAGAGEEDI